MLFHNNNDFIISELIIDIIMNDENDILDKIKTAR